MKEKSKNPKEAAEAIKSIPPYPVQSKKINITVGATVKAGECVIIMEAMKMDNNVMAEKGGVVQAVKVKEGDAVLQGDTLVEIA